MSEQAYDAALDLLRRLNPQKISKHLTNISRLSPTIAEDLLSSIDVPLGVSKDPEGGKHFLTCDYNRDLDSFRSPWSNKYYPSLQDEDESPFPSEELRDLELKLNDSFDIYRDLYYEGGISSVYLWDQEEDGDFAGVVLLKKQNEVDGSAWDSIHVLEVELNGNGGASYKVTSTIILELSNELNLQLSGNLIRQTFKEFDNHDHIVNIGTLIEDIESKLRNLLQQVYFGKTRDIIGDLRTLSNSTNIELERKRQNQVVQGIQGL